MRRFYCEYSNDSVDHVSPSIAALGHGFEDTGYSPRSILDLGCGNGRNSLYLAKKYGSNVLLVDSDLQMLDWARTVFDHHELSYSSLHMTIEELASRQGILKGIGFEKFDVTILSYLIQHIDPAYYPLILDFCKEISKNVIIDVYWNPKRVYPGEIITIGSVSWYGLTYEELASLVAPRFNVIDHRLVRSNSSVTINLVLKEGTTCLEQLIKSNHDYVSSVARKIRYAHRKERRISPKVIEFNSITCSRLIAELYPSEFDLVRAELENWLHNSSYGVPRERVAAKFLLLCRLNKIPVLFSEVTRDFEVNTKKLMHMMSLDYLPPLSVSDYIDRLSRHLDLPEVVRKEATGFGINDGLVGSNPAVRACCAVITAAKVKGIHLAKNVVADALGITPMAIRQAQERQLGTLA